MDISLESYELYNEIFLAESELFESMVSFGSDIVNESGALISINEGVKETLSKYIEKITAAIQKAWEKFKELVMDTKDDAWLKLFQKKITTGEPSFTINNFPQYDMNKLGSYKLIPFNYEEMKDSLSSKDAFISKYYGDLSGEGSISEKLERLVIKSRQDTKCTSELLKDIYKFCAADVKAEISKIEVDLKTINNSNQNIERLLNSITTDQGVKEAVALYESYLLEEDNSQDKSDKMSFTDDKSSSDDTNKNDNSAMVKSIQVYMSGSTDILSAKMKILKDMKKEYMSILKHFVGPEKSSNKDEEKKEDGNTSTSKNKIKI